MNVGPVMVWLLSTRIPPNHNTMTIITVPRNSLMGWASCWRMFTFMMLLRNSEFTLSKRSFIFSSAQKALMIRSPPRVSSTWLMVSLHSPCAATDFAFSFLPMIPMNHPNIGTKKMVNRVSCQLMMSSVVK